MAPAEPRAGLAALKLNEADYRAWAKWQEAGRHPSMRPKRLPHAIPPTILRQWQERYRQAHRPKPPAPPVPPPSRFGGAGLFTAWDPGVILRRRPLVDWVAVTTDRFNGEPGCSAVMAAQLRAAGYQTFAWESRMELGQQAVDSLHASAYIGQAETQGELLRCLALTLTVAKGLVGNPTAWLAEGLARAEAQDWELLLECYWNEQPWYQPDSRGLKVASYVLGLYPVHGEQKTLAEYREHWPSLSTSAWSGYLAEEMCEEDWHTLGSRPAA